MTGLELESGAAVINIVEVLFRELRARFDAVVEENARLRSELARLTRENVELCDTVDELRSMNERGREDLQ